MEIQTDLQAKKFSFYAWQYHQLRLGFIYSASEVCNEFRHSQELRLFFSFLLVSVKSELKAVTFIASLLSLFVPLPLPPNPVYKLHKVQNYCVDPRMLLADLSRSVLIFHFPSCFLLLEIFSKAR